MRDSLSRETDEPAARRSPGRPPLEEIINLRHPLVRLAGALVVNPRTGRAIDDVTLRLRFPEELCQAKAKVSLILGTSLLGGALGMLARNHSG